MDFLEQKINPTLLSWVKWNEIEGSIFKKSIPYKNRRNIKSIDFSTGSKWQKNKKIKILDIGCGSWRLLNYLNEKFSVMDYLWIDSSSWMTEEAKKEFPNNEFLTLDMTELDKLTDKYDIIFLIASYHHLSSIEKRIETLKKIKNNLKSWWMVFMTNWNLLGEKNFHKYEKNYYWNWDFQIKIWEFSRYYHSFGIPELESLYINEDFEILENRVFDNWNNIISIIQKK